MLSYRRFVAVAALVLGVAFSADAKTIKAYHIGNSLTDNIYPGGLGRLAEQNNDVYTYGKQVSPGVPLYMNWKLQSKTGSIYTRVPYGKYTTALKNYSWDVMTLQPFDSTIDGSNGDLAMAKNFINFAKSKNPNLQTYIYERWPRQQRDSKGNLRAFDYTALYTKSLSSPGSQSNERREYFETLLSKVNSSISSSIKKVLMVPLGDVLLELDKRIKAGKVHNISKIQQFYADDLHLNKVGGYVASMTFYSTMFKESPVGTSVPGAFGSINSTLAGELQDAVWDVVSTHPLAGVRGNIAVGTTVPEPASLGLILLVPAMLRRRR